MSTPIISIPFHGQNVLAVDHNGKQVIAFRHVCDQLGIDSASALRRLRSKSWASVVKMTVQLPGDRQTREVSFVDSRTLTMFLATVSEKKVSDEVRPLLIAYQSEIADVLDSYFNNGGAINPRATEHQIRSLELRAQSQLEMIQAAKGLIHPDHLEAKARVVLARGLGEHAELDENRRPLYTQDYLKEKGLQGKKLAATAGVFGKRVKRAYIDKYGIEPEKYPLNVKNGQTRNVLAYTEQDRHLMEQVWAEYYGSTESATPALDLA